ncbi:esterase-like activity of phytase family protein [Streptomyces sp. NPDC002851]
MSMRALGAAAATAVVFGSVLVTPSAARTPDGGACSSSVAIDGYSDALDKTEFQGVFVGNLSALATDAGGRTLALSDRSQLFSLDADSLRPRGVVRLADESGEGLDAEGLAVNRDGTRLVASESEPSIRQYRRNGALAASLPVPDALRVAPVGRAVENQTFEGLTLKPGGRTLVAAMEGPLGGDGAGIVRLQTWSRDDRTRDFQLAAQYGYRTDADLGVSETAATPDGRLLVLERGFTAGVGNTVRLYLADTRRATDVSDVEHLSGQEGVDLVHKTLLADLVDCPSLGAPAKQPQPNPLLDNIEAMAVTGRTSDGGLCLLLASDDNENAKQITRFYHLTVRTPAQLDR